MKKRQGVQGKRRGYGKADGTPLYGFCVEATVYGPDPDYRIDRAVLLKADQLHGKGDPEGR